MIFKPSNKFSALNPLGAVSRAHHGSERWGAALIEFAIVVPFLCFLLLGTFELSRGIMVKSVLSDASRRACRMGALPGKANSDITAEVNNILNDNQIPTGSVTITIQVNDVTADANTAQRNDKVSVRVAIPISSVFWAGTLFLSGSTIESETVSMMRQG